MVPDGRRMAAAYRSMRSERCWSGFPVFTATPYHDHFFSKQIFPNITKGLDIPKQVSDTSPWRRSVTAGVVECFGVRTPFAQRSPRLRVCPFASRSQTDLLNPMPAWEIRTRFCACHVESRSLILLNCYTHQCHGTNLYY